jgi:crotonobetainyl-CoA:carnitine CoA-transferase CaiB-like acyl-CoA transferase
MPDGPGRSEDEVAPPPLSGLVVVDFTRILAGPICTMVLSDMGAEVVKIERPDGGDDTRSWGPPFVGDDAAYFLSLNRGKKSLTLDLSDAADVAVARQLAASADVVVENFRSGIMERFGLHYDSLRAENPRLVYCSIPAFASTDQAKPGYDLLMQAACGLMSVTGEERPVKAGVAILDVVTGLYAVSGVLAALAAREKSGCGQHVRVGLFEASVSAMVNQAANYLMGGVVPGLAGNAHPNIVPYQAFRASDGDFVLAAGNDKLFRLTAELAGVPEVARDDRFLTNSARVANREILVRILQEQFEQQPAEHWVRRCDQYGVPASSVRTMEQVFASPEGAALLAQVDDPTRGPLRYVRTPIDFSATPLREPAPAPVLGADGVEVLDSLRRRREVQSAAPFDGG